MAELFEEFSKPGYPRTPGFRRTDTSKGAAEAMEPSVAYLQTKALRAIRRKPMTSWELSRHLGIAFESIQPRTSELQKLGLIEDSGERGPARSPHRTAIRWRVVAEPLAPARAPTRGQQSSTSDSSR